MTFPIQYALLHPERAPGVDAALDFTKLLGFEFRPVDELRFPCFRLARQVMAAGGVAPAVFNAANEVAVAAFLAGQIPFLAIPRVIDQTLQTVENFEPATLAAVLDADAGARRHRSLAAKKDFLIPDEFRSSPIPPRQHLVHPARGPVFRRLDLSCTSSAISSPPGGGVKVERFSIGFGPAIVSWRGRDGVEYRLAWIPLGGYVLLPQLADLGPIEGKSEADVEKLPPVSYSTKMIVFVAGALFNVLFAFGLASIIWVIGQPESNEIASTRIGYVVPKIELPGGAKVTSPAVEADLRIGDLIKAIDGHPVTKFFDTYALIGLGAGQSADGRRRRFLPSTATGGYLMSSCIPNSRARRANAGRHRAGLRIERAAGDAGIHCREGWFSPG